MPEYDIAKMLSDGHSKEDIAHALGGDKYDIGRMLQDHSPDDVIKALQPSYAIQQQPAPDRVDVSKIPYDKLKQIAPYGLDESGRPIVLSAPFDIEKSRFAPRTKTVGEVGQWVKEHPAAVGAGLGVLAATGAGAIPAGVLGGALATGAYAGAGGLTGEAIKQAGQVITESPNAPQTFAGSLSRLATAGATEGVTTGVFALGGGALASSWQSLSNDYKRLLIGKYLNLDAKLEAATSALSNLGKGAYADFKAGLPEAKSALGKTIKSVYDFVDEEIKGAGKRYGIAQSIGRGYADPQKIKAINENITAAIEGKTVPLMAERGKIADAIKQYGVKEDEEAALAGIEGLKGYTRIEKLIDNQMPDDKVLDALGKMDLKRESQINNVIKLGEEKYMPDIPVVGSYYTRVKVLEELSKYQSLQSLSPVQAKEAKWLIGFLKDLRNKPVVTFDNFINTLKAKKLALNELHAGERAGNYSLMENANTEDAIGDAMRKDMNEASKHLSGNFGDAMKEASAEYASAYRIKNNFSELLPSKLVNSENNVEAIADKFFKLEHGKLTAVMEFVSKHSPPGMIGQIRQNYMKTILADASVTTEKGLVSIIDPYKFTEYMSNSDNALKAKAVLGADYESFSEALKDANNLKLTSIPIGQKTSAAGLKNYVEGTASMSRESAKGVFSSLYNHILGHDEKVKLLTTEEGRMALKAIMNPSGSDMERRKAGRLVMSLAGMPAAATIDKTAQSLTGGQ